MAKGSRWVKLEIGDLLVGFWKTVSCLTVLWRMIMIAAVKRLTIMPIVTLPLSTAEQTLVKLMRVGDRLWRESDEKFAQWQLTDNTGRTIKKGFSN